MGITGKCNSIQPGKRIYNFFQLTNVSQSRVNVTTFCDDRHSFSTFNKMFKLGNEYLHLYLYKSVYW